MSNESKERTANIVLAIGGLNGFVSTEVQNSTFVLRLKFSAKSPAHRQYAARYRQPRDTKTMKKILYIAIIFLLASCGHTNNNSDKSEVTNVDTTKINTLTDKTVKFLLRDSSASIVINEKFCKTISDPEKAALGYVATFIGNECWWDGDYTDKRDNLKCEILTALNLGYQCSGKHLGFLRKWFKNDTTAIKELEACPTIPNTSTIQDTFDEITLTTKGNQITVFFKANGVSMREERSWTWSQTDYFQFNKDNIKLIKQAKSKVKVEHFDASED